MPYGISDNIRGCHAPGLLCIIINIKDPEIPVLESLTLCQKEKKYAEYIYNYSGVIQVPVRINYNNGSE